jgi:hypothetical protein
VTTVFAAAERFDFVAFDPRHASTGDGASRDAASLTTAGAPRATPGLFGAGCLEMTASQITRDLQRIRDTIRPGQSRALVSKGIEFGTLARRADGTWDITAVDPWDSGAGAPLRAVTNDERHQPKALPPS